MDIVVTHIDTACVLIEINGYRILTDPTLDQPGAWYHHGFGAFSKKTAGPAVATLDKIDLVLLSHHQHKDNLDTKGRAILAQVPLVISTKTAARAIPGVMGLYAWDSLAISTAKIPGLRITATPAQHRPWWLPEFISGKVIGFIIEFEGQHNGVIYISGDTVYFNGLAEVSRRFKIDIGLFHVGDVQFRYLTGCGSYTMDGNSLLKAVQLMQPNVVIPIHHFGWSHFKQKPIALEELLLSANETKDKVILLSPGIATRFER
ncbi:MAG: MBL fold metallo-hydrolase [Chitinophagaceae bacterium]|nr:MAG: MBL fold metallo-hydrolase [Chitinophagaceae bacterium]